MLPVLHLWICSLDTMENIMYHYNCRLEFPNQTPIMKNGLNKGTAEDGRSLTEHVKDAKNRLISKALDTIGILLDSPTASGSAGNSGMYTYLNILLELQS